MDVSVGGSWFGGYMYGRVVSGVVFRWMYAEMCLLVCGYWVDVCMDVSVGVLWLG